MEIAFAQALIVLGAAFVTLAALSGWLDAAALSATVLAVAGGAALAWAGVASVTPGAHAMVLLIELTLVLTLFADGMKAEAELLRRHWHPPVRALAIAMPLTLAFTAPVGHALFPALTWTEAALLGAILMPTDPVITSSLVGSPSVPRRVRHTLNLESGLNDGLALPIVLILIAASATGGAPASSAARLAGESVAGAAIGGTLALAARALLSRVPHGGISPRYRGLFALGIALGAYGLADATIGNGLLAAFVAGIALAIRRGDLPEAFGRFNETLGTALQLTTFLTFGATIVAVGWGPSTPRLAAFVLFVLVVARPLAVAVAFIGVDLSLPERLFVAWFGPKGVASMLFALLALNSLVPDRALVFEIASFTVLGSIAAHGLTETLGARWIHRRMKRRAA